MGKKDVRFGDATIGLTLQYHVFAHLALSSLAKCKNGTHGNENQATYFWYFGSFDEKQTCQNDMKSISVEQIKKNDHASVNSCCWRVIS